MKCPICGKELELRNKQVGTGENGEPVFNRYAICRDCKKQWNLTNSARKNRCSRLRQPLLKKQPLRKKPLSKNRPL